RSHRSDLPSTRERNLDAPVAPALAANLEHADGPDLGDVAYMRAAAGLQVDPWDPQQANASASARGLHAHRLDELGPGIELLIGDPYRLRLDAARDQRVRLPLDRDGVEQAHVDVE